MCHCCGEEGHLSTECPKQHTTPKKDWFVKKAINAHQQDDTGNQDSNNTNNASGNNNNNQDNDNNNICSVRWNNLVSSQSFQTTTRHVKNTQVQLHQLAVNHNQCYKTEENNEPVNFKKDALIDTGASFSSLTNVQPLDNVVMAEEPMTVGTNAGNKTLQEHGELVVLKPRCGKIQLASQM